MLMNWLRKHRFKIFFVTIGGFLIGTFMGFGDYFFNRSPYDVAISVNKEKINYKQYKSRLQRNLQQNRKDNKPLTDADIQAVRNQTIQEIVQQTVMIQEANKYGIEVTDNELAAFIQRYPYFQRDDKFDQAIYFQVVTQAMRTTPEEFEEEQRKLIKIEKLRGLLASTVKIPPMELSRFLQKEMANKSRKEREEIMKDPESLREKIRTEQVNEIFREWFTHLSSEMDVNTSYLNKWDNS